MTTPTMSLGDRMKNYENVDRKHLMRRNPTVIRIDGKAFHTWTRGLKKPYDDSLVISMAETMKYLVDSIQGAVLGYTQSDEISIFLRDYDRLVTEAWFDNNIQKMVSVSASLATAFFNSHVATTWADPPKYLATFDSRVFSLPKEEVTNYFLWRQQDCTRNSVQGAGQHYLGHKKTQNLNSPQIQEALMALDPPINWNDFPVYFKRGTAYIKDVGSLDYDMPILREDKAYINNLVYIKETTNE